jgi:MFS family permease
MDASAEKPDRPSSGNTDLVTAAAADAITKREGRKPFVEHFEGQDAAWRESTNRRLLRKIDARLLPCLVVMYLLNFLDRSNLAQARQGTLERDLAMTGTDFNLATSIFFVGYLLMQLPSNLLITRVRPSLYLSMATLLWGAVSTCNAAVRNFHSLVVVRFFLGFVEAPFFPGAIFLMSSWYTRAELTRRIAWFYSGNALANMFGGLLGAAILGSLEGAHGIAGWRWLFIVVSPWSPESRLFSGIEI